MTRALKLDQVNTAGASNAIYYGMAADYAEDFALDEAAREGTYVVQGCILAPSGTGGKVDLTSGIVFINGVETLVSAQTAAGTSTSTLASGLSSGQALWALFEIDTSGTLQTNPGSGGQSDLTHVPPMPTPNANRCVAGKEFVPVGATLVDQVFGSATGTKAKLIDAARPNFYGSNPNDWLYEQGTFVWGSVTQLAIAGDQTRSYRKGTRVSVDDGTNTGAAPFMGPVLAATVPLAAPLTSVSATHAGTTTAFGKTAHGMANGTPVVVTGLVNITSGVVNNGLYFVVNTAANTFGLAATVGGTAITLGGSSDDAAVTVTGATLITFFPMTDFNGGVQNGTLKYPRYSNAPSPNGWPTIFNWAPTLSGWGPNPSTVALLTSVTTTIASSLLTKTSHGLTNGTPISVSGASTTTPLSTTNNVATYFVVGATTNTFQVAVTKGGAAVTFGGTADSSITVSVLTGYTYAVLGGEYEFWIRHGQLGTSTSTSHAITLPAAVSAAASIMGFSGTFTDTVSSNTNVQPGGCTLTPGSNVMATFVYNNTGGTFLTPPLSATNTATGSSRVNTLYGKVPF